MVSIRGTRTRTTTAAIALSASALLVLAGCSSNAPEEAAPVATETGSAAIATPVILKDGALSICTSSSPPNIYYDDNSELIGVEIDIAGALATELGLDLEIQEYAFSGLIPALQAQQCDAVMGSLYIKPEREEIANFVPYLYSGTAVATSKANPSGITGNDESLCGTRVVAINGATGAVVANDRSALCTEAGLEPLDITLVDEGTNGIQQVLAGQAEAFIDTTDIVSFYEQKSDGDLVMAGEPFGKIRIGAATLKDNTELNEALDVAFEAIVSDGTYGEILAEWGSTTNDITVSE